jgi:hypothetical protein
MLCFGDEKRLMMRLLRLVLTMLCIGAYAADGCAAWECRCWFGALPLAWGARWLRPGSRIVVFPWSCSPRSYAIFPTQSSLEVFRSGRSSEGSWFPGPVWRPTIRLFRSIVVLNVKMSDLPHPNPLPKLQTQPSLSPSLDFSNTHNTGKVAGHLIAAVLCTTEPHYY